MSAFPGGFETPGLDPRHAAAQPLKPLQPVSALTPREREVLNLMADGLTTKAIAVRLKVTFKTAACHRNHILQKLNVTSTVSAVRWAIREGLIVA